jgi:2-keto-3-deoxy-L-rhamnonate aldolase RhmA
MKLSIGSWCGIGHPAVADMLARAGFEWLALDCEHGEAENADIGNFCRACHQYGSAPYVRVKSNDIMSIRRALDLGAQGVIVPLVNSAAEAEQAVRAASYPPRGVRGFAWHRGNAWGEDFGSYAADFRPRVIVMIESKTAVDEIDDIMKTEGVDGCLIGPYDLSGSMGIPGQTDAPVVTEACARVARAAIRAGKMAGSHIVVPTPERISLALKQGYTLLALGVDEWFLRNGAAMALQALKTAAESGRSL